MWKYNYGYSQDELYHRNGFKYIKREWKNGKWNYYYKDKSIGIADKIADKIGLDEKKIYEDSKRSYDAYNKAVKEFELDYKDDKELIRKSNQIKEIITNNHFKTLDAYYATPVGKISKMTDKINKGKNYILTLFAKKK